jgi:hypothetical protein
MTASELARLLNAPCGLCGDARKNCRRCKGSGRNIPPDQVERELAQWFRITATAALVKLLKVCRDWRQTIRTVAASGN